MRFDEGKTNNFEKESPLQTFKDRNITPAKALPFDLCDPIFLQYWSSQLVSISSGKGPQIAVKLSDLIVKVF